MKTKDIKDYLHLYMGCEVEVQQNWRANNFEPVLEHKAGAILRVDPILLAIIREREDFKVKPILRPLSDMTEEEWFAVETKICLSPVEGHGYLQDNFIKDMPDDRFSWGVTNKAIIELRKMGIDCDGLIESGLAISSLTINSPTP